MRKNITFREQCGRWDLREVSAAEEQSALRRVGRAGERLARQGCASLVSHVSGFGFD